MTDSLKKLLEAAKTAKPTPDTGKSSGGALSTATLILKTS
jgi:hypothetical protein